MSSDEQVVAVIDDTVIYRYCRSESCSYNTFCDIQPDKWNQFCTTNILNVMRECPEWLIVHILDIKYTKNIYTIVCSDFKCLLRDYTSNNTEERRKLLYDIAYSINELHENNIIHCNLSPNNIVLTHNKSILISFMTQILNNTPDVNYTAPETKRDKKADAFSFGAIYYFLMTNSHPDIKNINYDSMYENDARVIKALLNTDPDKRMSIQQFLLKYNT